MEIDTLAQFSDFHADFEKIFHGQLIFRPWWVSTVLQRRKIILGKNLDMGTLFLEPKVQGQYLKLELRLDSFLVISYYLVIHKKLYSILAMGFYIIDITSYYFTRWQLLIIL